VVDLPLRSVLRSTLVLFSLFTISLQRFSTVVVRTCTQHTHTHQRMHTHEHKHKHEHKDVLLGCTGKSFVVHPSMLLSLPLTKNSLPVIIYFSNNTRLSLHFTLEDVTHQIWSCGTPLGRLP